MAEEERGLEYGDVAGRDNSEYGDVAARDNSEYGDVGGRDSSVSAEGATEPVKPSLVRPYVSHLRPKHLRDEDEPEVVASGPVGPLPLDGDSWDSPAAAQTRAGGGGGRPGPRGSSTLTPNAGKVRAVVVAGVAVILTMVLLAWSPLGETRSSAGISAKPGIPDLVPSDAITTDATSVVTASASATAAPSATATSSPKPKATKTVPQTNPTAQPTQPPAPAVPPPPAATGPSPVAIAPRTARVLGASGRCLDDQSSLTTEGNNIQTWPCNGSAAESFTFGTDATLRVFNLCVRPNGSAKPSSGTIVLLRSCDGTYRSWYYRSDQAIVNTDSGLCLTEANSYNANGGNVVTVTTCTGAANQRWPLS